jgi:ABC-2 type transport system ATP-binding protein
VTTTLLLDNSAWVRLAHHGLAPERSGEIADALEAGGIAVSAVTVARPSLEDVYLRYAGRTFSAAEAEKGDDR